MNPANRWPLRFAAAVALALAAGLLTMTDLSGQDQPRRRMRTVMVNGHEAVAGEVMVRYRNPQGTIERQRAEHDVDADEVEMVGRCGLRRRGDPGSTLPDFQLSYRAALR